MRIQQLSRSASVAVVERLAFGRLACVSDGQPYVVPFYFKYHNDYIYSFSSAGKKIDWMRNNPLVCVEADERSDGGGWTSVIAFGRYEELPDTEQMKGRRTFAATLLQQRAQWWEPAAVKPEGNTSHGRINPVLFRIEVVEITGRRAIVEEKHMPSEAAINRDAANGWLQRLLERVKGNSRPPPS